MMIDKIEKFSFVKYWLFALSVMIFLLFAITGCGKKKTAVKSPVYHEKTGAVVTKEPISNKSIATTNIATPDSIAKETSSTNKIKVKEKKPEWLSVIQNDIKKQKDAGQQLSAGLGGPMSRATAAKESSRWLTGTPEKRVKAIRDANMGTRALPAELFRLARQGSDEGLQALLMLSSNNDGMAEEAIRALGAIRAPSQKQLAAEEISKRFNDKNVVIAVTAMKSYILLRGDDSLDDVRSLIQKNYRRNDGFGEYVCSEIIDSVGKLRTAEANKILTDQLKRVKEPNWLPDYGSKIVEAIRKQQKVQDLTEDVVETLEMYMQELQKKMPGEDNPPGRKYYEEKIEEVKAVLAGRKEVLSKVL